MNTDFLDAFNFSMKYEVGLFWNPNDPDVIAGKCDSPYQKKRVGWCNVPGDSGGETKFGIAQNYNKDVNVRTLTLVQAQQVYFKKYWAAASCDKVQSIVNFVLFDIAVNMGVGRAIKFLQEAAGVSADGQIGNMTLKAVNSMQPKELALKLCSIREAFYMTIVKNKPDQKKFLNGWLTRNESIRKYVVTK